MPKFPSFRNVKAVTDMIYYEGSVTRSEIAERLSLGLSSVSVIVRFLLTRHIVEQRKDANHTSRGPKDRRIYLRRNTYFVILDVSSDIWRCFLCAPGHKLTFLCEHRYKTDTDLSHNLDVFLSDAEYSLRHAVLYRIPAVSVIIPCEKTSKSCIYAPNRMLKQMPEYSHDLSKMIFARASRKCFVELHCNTLIARESLYLRINKRGTLAVCDAIEHGAIGKDRWMTERLNSFSNAIGDCETNSEYADGIYGFVRDVFERYGTLKFDIDVDIPLGNSVSKIQKEAEKLVMRDLGSETAPRISLAYADKSLIYRDAAYFALVRYLESLLTQLKRANTKKSKK